ncbi:hypothetical protein AJ79_03483 [Helicocarpus griseus UAMH5409]|uniref:protein-ribulosamine 3-kinase n=1 Tax=Helicocarpus griseus UAMH5409 TaxID=1447875 RepID=A0A2B7XYC5_9EURO|nr:hypothetical protein AJ79_03483 [Helicocarpus griseus UAMH5409]
MEKTDKDASCLTAALSPGSEIISVVKHGKTNWSSGLRVDTKVDGYEKTYFVKIIEQEEFVAMAEAEFEGQKTVAAIIPDNAVEPIAWGYYEVDKTKPWFLTHFRHLQAQPPPLQTLLSTVKRLHQQSHSPTGKFRFHITSYYGPPPMIVDWTDDWRKLAELANKFIDKVVPRLLRPLQTGGRSIKPTLCHGDLWDGNIQIDAHIKLANNSSVC